MCCLLQNPTGPIKDLSYDHNYDLINVKFNIGPDPVAYYISPQKSIVYVVPVVYGVYPYKVLLNM